MSNRTAFIAGLAAIVLAVDVGAMGIRSFVALPLEGATVRDFNGPEDTRFISRE